MVQTLKLAYSPCPNDTFLFAGLALGAVAGRLDFDISLHDIQELNHMAANAEADLVKISFFNYPQIQAQYEIMDTGSALGFGTGPLLISKDGKVPDRGTRKPTAIPGRNTTANLLLSMALPDLDHKKEYLFSEIEEAVRLNEAAAGAIIHESRFTYEQRGLKLSMDLGQWWENHTGLPVPLGGLAIKRSLPDEVKEEADKMLKKSLLLAQQERGEMESYIRAHAQEMNPKVMQQHIGLYVNDYTYSLRPEGREAIRRLLGEAEEKKQAGKCRKDIFAGYD